MDASATTDDEEKSFIKLQLETFLVANNRFFSHSSSNSSTRINWKKLESQYGKRRKQIEATQQTMDAL
jgi:hypothetical protein